MSDGGDAGTRRAQQTLVQITRRDICMKFEGGHEVRLTKLLMPLSVSSTPLPELQSLTSKELGPAYPTVYQIAGVIEMELPSCRQSQSSGSDVCSPQRYGQSQHSSLSRNMK
jgi:hypothetical protein